MVPRLLLLAFAVSLCHAQSVIITTVIGTGVLGSGGDGGPGRGAQLNNPNGVAVDSAGNLYVADYGNNKIRKLLVATDLMVTIAGCGNPGSFCIDEMPGRSAITTLITGPWDVALDSTGSFYFPNGGRHRIEKVTNPAS